VCVSVAQVLTLFTNNKKDAAQLRESMVSLAERVPVLERDRLAAARGSIEAVTLLSCAFGVTLFSRGFQTYVHEGAGSAKSISIAVAKYLGLRDLLTEAFPDKPRTATQHWFTAGK